VALPFLRIRRCDRGVMCATVITVLEWIGRMSFRERGSSVKKKMAELEVELLHCKQERDIPEVWQTMPMA
jgi:hypothetical protein